MGVPSQLVLCGGTVYLLLGCAHAVWALLDVRQSRRFVPDDRAIQEGMRQSTLRLSGGRTTMWNAWLGFNISHGLGAAIFGALAILVAVYRDGHLAEPWALAVLVGVSTIYLALALRFWFYVPALGIGLATACFAAALAYSLLM